MAKAQGQRSRITTDIDFNAEQALSSNLGTFLRAMNADGRTETYAFTEVDASVAAGLSLKGGAWQRGKDTVGVALMRNMLGADRRDYLRQRGGDVGYEAPLEQQVARRIAADHQLRKDHELGALRGEFGVRVEDPAAVAREVADRGVELG